MAVAFRLTAGTESNEEWRLFVMEVSSFQIFTKSFSFWTIIKKIMIFTLFSCLRSINISSWMLRAKKKFFVKILFFSFFRFSLRQVIANVPHQWAAIDWTMALVTSSSMLSTLGEWGVSFEAEILMKWCESSNSQSNVEDVQGGETFAFLYLFQI